MRQRKDDSAITIGLMSITAVQAILITMKIIGKVNYSWLEVFCPTITAFILTVAALIIILLNIKKL